MSKVLEGKVVSTKMGNTIVVSVERKTPHPLYRKLLRRSKRFLVETEGKTVELGKVVKIVETKPLSKNKHFKLLEGTK